VSRQQFAANLLFRLGGAFDDPIARFRDELKELAEHGAEVLGVTEVRAHAGAQLGFVDEFIGVRAVLEWRLCAEQQGVNIGRRAAVEEFARERELVGEQRRVRGAVDFGRQIKPPE